MTHGTGLAIFWCLARLPFVCQHRHSHVKIYDLVPFIARGYSVSLGVDKRESVSQICLEEHTYPSGYMKTLLSNGTLVTSH